MKEGTATSTHTFNGAAGARYLVKFPWRGPRRGSLLCRWNEGKCPQSNCKRGTRGSRTRALPMAGFDNDPSAGSPTETLLRLLLPLNDKVQWTSRDVAGSEPLASPRSEHFTGPFNR
ncbi:hypothetical protein Ddye_032645 [Dipteronia dyeriana]|uniref:Uncharacterized protein n=1 Tax=Dipteronia dyeriana TaxID=168575 RepID=A0AAD9TCP1_9ROSI|nr:hypothetical protein Ddye_032440 [Dipteronia dyeriana]KAK2633298.1 hypothetical protein Ddye_032444 [Dipteronia dyeriana]KAK2633302.1 hypothetical protein Ddye_032448 [Dipteronia dyeriana]KAK2633342.1 hypothetical protein Ddye_032811 [Dipteronia dyeriana]KAK2633344.1 hypothetical protein Ddye_032813 [Dipteronia dyeriana]